MNGVRMDSQAVGIGLIGVGRHGIRYARHILQDLPNAALVAVSRQHPEQGVGLPGCDSVTTYREGQALIADPSVDVVVVVTPPIFSRALCVHAIQAGKPVLVEKPLAATADDARAMAEAAAGAHVPLMTGQTMRFDATIQALKTRRASIGRSQQLRLNTRIEMKSRERNHADGYGKRGALLEIGVHMLDLVRFLTEEEVREVRCTMRPIPPTAPDMVASVQLVTAEGTDCRIEVARSESGRVGTVEWIGSEGRFTADWIQQRLQWIGPDEQTESWRLSACPTVLLTLRAFLEAVQEKRSMPITGEDGFRAVELAEACYRSAASHGAAVALPLPC
jgi:predicted dehydrogenase